MNTVSTVNPQCFIPALVLQKPGDGRGEATPGTAWKSIQPADTSLWPRSTSGGFWCLLLPKAFLKCLMLAPAQSHPQGQAEHNSAQNWLIDGFPSWPGQIHDVWISLKACSSAQPFVGSIPLSHSGYLRHQGCGFSCRIITACLIHPISSWVCRAQTPTGQSRLMLQLPPHAMHRPHPPDRLTAANQLCAEHQDPANLLFLPSANPSAAVSIWEASFPDQNEWSICQGYQCVDISLAGLHLLCLKNKQDKIPNSLMVLAWSSLMRMCWERPELLGFFQAQEESLLQELF